MSKDIREFYEEYKKGMEKFKKQEEIIKKEKDDLKRTQKLDKLLIKKLKFQLWLISTKLKWQSIN